LRAWRVAQARGGATLFEQYEKGRLAAAFAFSG